MLEIGETEQQKRGALFESIVLSAAAIAFGTIAFADFLNHAMQDGSEATTAIAQHKASLRNGVDYSATGTIIPLRQMPALNPCEKN